LLDLEGVVVAGEFDCEGRMLDYELPPIGHGLREGRLSQR
jgi:roadblock/LC7 domain-containing protein